MSNPFQHNDFIFESEDGIKKSYNNINNNNIEKRKRVKLSKQQTQRLAFHFEKNCMPQLNDRVIIGNEIGISQKTVQIWFQNRRAKNKKNEREQYEINRFYPNVQTGFYPNDLPNLETCNIPDPRFSLPLYVQPYNNNNLIYEQQQSVYLSSFENQQNNFQYQNRDNNYQIPPWFYNQYQDSNNIPNQVNSNVIFNEINRDHEIRTDYNNQSQNNRSTIDDETEEEQDFF